MASREQSTASLGTTAILICRHAINGLAPRIKMCAYSHQCSRCAFDQMLDDVALDGNTSLETQNPDARAA